MATQTQTPAATLADALALADAQAKAAQAAIRDAIAAGNTLAHDASTCHRVDARLAQEAREAADGLAALASATTNPAALACLERALAVLQRVGSAQEASADPFASFSGHPASGATAPTSDAPKGKRAPEGTHKLVTAQGIANVRRWVAEGLIDTGRKAWYAAWADTLTIGAEPPAYPSDAPSAVGGERKYAKACRLACMDQAASDGQVSHTVAGARK